MGASWFTVLLVFGGLPTGYLLSHCGLAVCAAGLCAPSPFSLYDSDSSPTARRGRTQFPLSSPDCARFPAFAPALSAFLRWRRGSPPACASFGRFGALWSVPPSHPVGLSGERSRPQKPLCGSAVSQQERATEQRPKTACGGVWAWLYNTCPRLRPHLPDFFGAGGSPPHPPPGA